MPIMTLVQLLIKNSFELEEKRAFSFLGYDGKLTESITFGDLDRSGRAIAAWLESRGLVQKPVLLLFPTGGEFIKAFVGCQYAAAIPVPSTLPAGSRHHLLRVKHLVRDSGASHILVSTAWKARIKGFLSEEGMDDVVVVCVEELDGDADDLWIDSNPSHLAFIQYSSGSTGNPKGVMVDHANLIHNSRILQARWHIRQDSVFASWLPFFHDMGLIGVIVQTLYTGASAIIISPQTFVKRPSLWLQMISDYRCDVAGAPNFGFEHCVKQISDEQIGGVDLSSWRVAFNGAEPVRHATLQRFSRRFITFGFRPEAHVPAYGLAEATLCVSSYDANSAHRTITVDPRSLTEVHEARPAAEGRAFVACGAVRDVSAPALDVRIVNPESRRELPDARIGEIWVAGASVARGYLGKEALSVATFHASLHGQEAPSYLRTGDLGFILEGQLYVTGRLKDLIVYNGRNISPEDVEHSALQDSDIAELMGDGVAFAISDNSQEHIVLMQEVTKRNLEPEDYAKAAQRMRRQVLRNIQVDLAQLVFIRRGVLPRTTSGKKQRKQACEMYLAGASDEALYVEDFLKPKLATADI
ncbi:fatty acyl-AMP ligase [Vreelandella titanicae]|uniref:fatty acyl-AMP ligase n=1 Tax=Vreelandella titanicae TaxID=664683 RepID=UPI00241F3F28|nr:fatty acyl-AMP ligase [Halomonas titanicae]UEQ05312.1 fatty acyl-AMP ligase [Halomonas profundus]